MMLSDLSAIILDLSYLLIRGKRAMDHVSMDRYYSHVLNGCMAAQYSLKTFHPYKLNMINTSP